MAGAWRPNSVRQTSALHSLSESRGGVVRVGLGFRTDLLIGQVALVCCLPAVERREPFTSEYRERPQLPLLAQRKRLLVGVRRCCRVEFSRFRFLRGRRWEFRMCLTTAQVVRILRAVNRLRQTANYSLSEFQRLEPSRQSATQWFVNQFHDSRSETQA